MARTDTTKALVAAATRAMLSSIKPVARVLALSGLFSAAAFAQSTDITGWHDLPWGTKKPVAAKALQSMHVHDCRPDAKTSCAETAGPDGLVIDAFPQNAALYEVDLLFSPAYGLSRVLLTASDEKGALDKALSQLTAMYGKPEFESRYDDDEQIETKWSWAKPHGKLSLESANGAFTIAYEARLDRSRK